MDDTNKNVSVSPIVKSEPVPLKPAAPAVDFYAAMKMVAEGKAVVRPDWTDEKAYVAMRDGIIQLYKADGWHSWVISRDDMAATDWVVI